MVIRARFDGRVFIPEQPVDLPAGSVVEILIAVPSPESGRSMDEDAQPLARLAEWARQLADQSDLPDDYAAQYEHYLYGLPKQP